MWAFYRFEMLQVYYNKLIHIFGRVCTTASRRNRLRFPRMMVMIWCTPSSTQTRRGGSGNKVSISLPWQRFLFIHIYALKSLTVIIIIFISWVVDINNLYSSEIWYYSSEIWYCSVCQYISIVMKLYVNDAQLLVIRSKIW